LDFITTQHCLPKTHRFLGVFSTRKLENDFDINIFIDRGLNIFSKLTKNAVVSMLKRRQTAPKIIAVKKY